ncbi:MAG: hypothetical protein QOF01_4815 [Thermomicrobiales bacterium]|nr:hypothetical protein [Thermomicrobiales bacterium]
MRAVISQSVDSTNSTSQPIYTIGHSNLPLDTFLAALAAHDIQVLADVRTRPFSRFPRFNRANLEASLAEAGIAYHFFGASLGGRPSDPTCYRDGVLPTRKEDFIQRIDYLQVAARPWYRDGIRNLLQLAATERVAIMCSEGDPQGCHRHHLIAQTLLDHVPVLHVMIDKTGASTTTPASREPTRSTLL